MPGNRISQMAVPAGVVGIVLMMVVPLPTFLLDLFIAVNITGALLVLLVTLFVRRPLDFAIFPALLLVATLFRLALNISATRLVLLHGFAGKVIEAFGHFVVGGSLVVGLVIFMILIVIQFVVITNGAGRVAEVGARFTLDAMPGKQMAIDADLNAGLIDEHDARRRRAEITAEADFYGAMDGGSKFVKGDAVAAIIITMINLFGGLMIGVVQKHMPIKEAISTYSLLSIGDGLVSQIPALLLSVATGLIVTRATSQGDMGSDLLAQMSQQRRALRIGGFAVLAACLVPGLPKLPFLLAGGSVLLAASRLPKEQQAGADEQQAAEPHPGPVPDSPEALAAEMRIDPLLLEVAYDLVDLVDPATGDLLDRVRALSRKVALELGIVLPLVRTRDNVDLPPSTYRISVHGVACAEGQAAPGVVLAIGDDLAGLPGTPTQEPVFGLPGKWVPAALRLQAELTGATVVDRTSVITTHLAEVVRQNASRLLGREDVKMLVELTRRTHPVVIEELTPALLTLGDIQRVLQSLLEDEVPIRDLVRIFEAMSQRARSSAEHEGLVEAARAALGGAIATPHVMDGYLRVLTLDPRLEQSLLECLRPGDGGMLMLGIDAEHAERLVNALGNALDAAERQGINPVLVCSPQLRAPLRRLAKVGVPRLPLLAYGEIGAQTRVETIGVVTLATAVAA
jgi:flagellar biosynthesis protein FlhA